MRTINVNITTVIDAGYDVLLRKSTDGRSVTAVAISTDPDLENIDTVGIDVKHAMTRLRQYVDKETKARES